MRRIRALVAIQAQQFVVVIIVIVGRWLGRGRRRLVLVVVRGAESMTALVRLMEERVEGEIAQMKRIHAVAIRPFHRGWIERGTVRITPHIFALLSNVDTLARFVDRWLAR
jgi:hypothetical protein